jgi:uncharacterized protein YbaR (Trm112 family)
MDHRLLELLVCPVTKGALELRRDDEGRPVELLSRGARLAFPIRDGLPVMIEHEARALAVDEAADHAPASPFAPR